MIGHPNFLTLVEGARKSPGTWTAMMKLWQKLKKVQVALKELNKKEY